MIKCQKALKTRAVRHPHEGGDLVILTFG